MTANEGAESGSNRMIPFNDLTADPPELKAAILDAMASVQDSGWYVLGPQVRSFEHEWAALCQTSECVGVASGLDAIEIGLRSHGIGAGDEVITSPMTAVATVLAILRAGATPVLADIDPETALLDPVSVDRCRTRRTKAVLLVHLYGQMRSMPMWRSFCTDHGLTLIEDCAQAHGASDAGWRAGAAGALGAYSFYPTKNLGAMGDAGALVTSDELLADRARQIRNYGQSDRYTHASVGLNSRLDELQAAILRVRLEWLTVFTDRRREVARRYAAGINNPAVRVMAPPLVAENHVHHLFVITSKQRNDLANHLVSRGVATLVHYPIPVHRQAPYRHLTTDPDGLTVAETHAATCLSLPVAPHLGDDDVEAVIEAVNSFRSHE